ncbi:MAG: 3-deoxy-7-phosphoheptulonate synthase [Lachnospiraceae bacterium]|nr:3-deoxy-7-phosphoheptulonate synthase [Lachnospiraceae bacterium]MEE0863362.1 3-deoxy-7-phosphoheptulonate synthase [Lachnospiraceae bacterium]
MAMNFHRKLPIPQEVKKEFPLTERMEQVKAKRDESIRDVFEGKSDKFILVIGPCSAERSEPVLEYISRLRKIEDQVSDKIIIIPRIYTNKPRTTGQGYKGMLHQPDPEAKSDMYKGIVSIRELHMAALRDYDFSCADEMLYPENHRYLSDLLSYVAVGARSVENQQHRLTASGLDVPVGMKNPTGGDLGVMMNSIVAAQSSHTFLYRGWEVTSDGNPYAHAILRGYVDYTGRSVSNYHYEDLLRVQEFYNKSNLVNPSIIVDTNHNNSGKQYLEQVRIAKDIVHSRNQNADIKKLVKGLMIESYIEDGAQSPDEHVFGKSITDPCLGWEKTEQLILDIAEKL